MQTIHSILFICHILAGSMALFLFWVPILTQKGSLDHRKFGRYYSNTMYAVACSGAIMACAVIFDPMALKGHLLKNPADAELFVYKIRVFWYFLLVLSLLTFVSIRQGLTTLKYKHRPEFMRSPGYTLPLFVLLFAGAALLFLGLKERNTLHIIFGVLSLLISFNMLRFCLARANTPKQWVIEHLSAMIGSGIGAYTAFLTFGARQLLENWGHFQLFFWIAPGVIGSIAITMMSRKYVIKS